MQRHTYLIICCYIHFVPYLGCQLYQSSSNREGPTRSTSMLSASTRSMSTVCDSSRSTVRAALGLNPPGYKSSLCLRGQRMQSMGLKPALVVPLGSSPNWFVSIMYMSNAKPHTENTVAKAPHVWQTSHWQQGLIGSPPVPLLDMSVSWTYLARLL